MWRFRLHAPFFLVFLALGCRPAPPAPATIEDIQYEAVAIDLDTANLREELRSIDRPSGGGTIVLRYRAGRKLRKVLARIYNDAGQKQDAYYLYNELPFLVVTRIIFFADPYSQRVVRVLTDSLYYAQGKLLRSMSVDSPATSPVARHLSTPLDSAAGRLHELLGLETTRGNGRR
jgi:hypothetical protein